MTSEDILSVELPDSVVVMNMGISERLLLSLTSEMTSRVNGD